MTVNALCDLYLESKARSRAPTSVAWYRRNLKQHVRPAIGNMRLADLKPIHVQRLLDGARDTSRRTSRRGQPLGATTLRNLLVGVRALLAWGVKQGLVHQNVASKVELPAQEYIERHALTAVDVKSVLAAAQGSPLAPVIATAVGTGLRRSEITALRWSDVDLDAGTLAVRRAAAMLDGKVLLKAPKTKRSQRTDHLPAFVVAVLRRQRADQLARYEVLYGELEARRRQKEGWVFDRGDGELWNPNELSKQFARFVRRKGLPLIRLHDLRHGYATLAFAAGIPLKVVSESLGHASMKITSDLYTTCSRIRSARLRPSSTPTWAAPSAA